MKLKNFTFMFRVSFFHLLAFLVLLIGGIADSHAQVSVTATAGTMGPSPYSTVKEAFDAINLGTHQGDISILLNGGTTETASAVLNASGGASSYTSVSLTASTAVVVTGNIIGAIIKLNGADNVTIDGRIGGAGRNITVSNSSTSGSTAAIWIASAGVGAGATNNTIRNLELACGLTQNTSTLSTFGIIMCGTTISSTSNGDDNDNNTFTENRIIRCRYGICTRGVTTNNNQNVMVTNNIIGPDAFGADEIGKVGIFMQADNLSTVSGNTVQYVGGAYANTTGGADRVGIAIGVESWSMAPSTITSGNYTVTKNIIHDVIDERTFSAVGLLLGTTGGGSATNNLVANNFIYNVKSNGTAGDQTVGLGISGGYSDRVVFNSIYLYGDVDPNASASATSMFGSGIRVANASGTTHQNLTLKNNIVHMDLLSSSTATTRYYAISGNTSAYSFGTGGEDNNCYYINPANTQCVTGGLGTTSGATLTNQFPTLANWQAAYTVTQDASSVGVNPGFNSTTDLHINLSGPGAPSLNGTGVDIAGVSDDIDMETRNSPPDMGADEFELETCAGADGGTISPDSYLNFCEGATISMTSTGATLGAGITYQWKVSATSGSGYIDVTGGSGANSTSYTTDALALGTYYYVLETTCEVGPVTDISNEVTVNVVNPIPTGTASGPANGVNGTPYNFTLSGYTPGDLQWQTATVISGPYSDYVGADSDMESLIFNLGTYYVRCKITSAAGCVGYSNVVTIVLTLANDNVCNALPLVEGYNGPYSNVGATVEPGEAQAPNTSCTGQTTWCPTGNGLVSSSIWFSLVAPAEGKVRINFSPGNFDSQIALWGASDCSDLLNSLGTLIAANDDSVSASPFHSWIAPVCLTPGETYFVQVDGYGSTTNSNIGLTVTIVAVDEICNSDIDDDCDGLVDEADPSLVDNIYWYQDNDGDLLGNPNMEIIDCDQPLGYVADSLDCNDNSTVSSCNTPTNPMVSGLTDVAVTLGWDPVVGAERYNLDFKLASDPSYPPAIKVYTNSYSFTGLLPGTKYTWRVRANCDTLCSINSSNLPGGSFFTNYRGYPDLDADGYGDETQPYVLLVSFPAAGYALNNTDCNDANSAVNPGITEVCNGVDDDCDDSIDEGTTLNTWYQDSDSDGLGNAAVSQMTCVQPVGYVSNSLDCNDGSLVAVCSVPADVSVETISTFSATLVWQSSPCVTFYGLQYKKSTDPAWTSVPAVYGDNYPLSGLTPGSLYLFRVRSRCTATTPVTSSAWVSGSFSTIALPMGLANGEVQTENISPVSLTIEVFPNPGDGIFNIILESDADREASMKLTDNLGKLILDEQWQLAKGETIRSLDMSHLPVGVYQIQVLQGDLMLTKKIVLMK